MKFTKVFKIILCKYGLTNVLAHQNYKQEISLWQKILQGWMYDLCIYHPFFRLKKRSVKKSGHYQVYSLIIIILKFSTNVEGCQYNLFNLNSV